MFLSIVSVVIISAIAKRVLDAEMARYDGAPVRTGSGRVVKADGVVVLKGSGGGGANAAASSPAKRHAMKL